MKYDDASWHYTGEFPEDSPEEFGSTHIALFMKWCFSKGWAGELHKEDSPEELQKVIDGSLSAVEYFIDFCDEKLTDEDFNDTGNKFASEYYGEKGLYLNDYAEEFSEIMYLKSEEEHDYIKLSEILERRLKSGQLTEDIL